jgi:hypothetical protein
LTPLYWLLLAPLSRLARGEARESQDLEPGHWTSA